MIELTKTQARQFILAKQGLMGKHRFSGKEGAYEYVRRAGSKGSKHCSITAPRMIP